MATALFCGAATSGDNALQEMLFQNHRRLEVKEEFNWKATASC